MTPQYKIIVTNPRLGYEGKTFRAVPWYLSLGFVTINFYMRQLLLMAFRDYLPNPVHLLCLLELPLTPPQRAWFPMMVSFSRSDMATGEVLVRTLSLA